MDSKCRICNIIVGHNSKNRESHFKGKKHQKVLPHTLIINIPDGIKLVEITEYFNKLAKIIKTTVDEAKKIAYFSFEVEFDLTNIIQDDHKINGIPLVISWPGKTQNASPKTTSNIVKVPLQSTGSQKALTELQVKNKAILEVQKNLKTFYLQTQTLYKQLKSKQEIFKRKQSAVIDDLKKSIIKAFPKIEILPFGSSITDLNYESSDLDICVCDGPTGKSKVINLGVVKNRLYASKLFTQIIFIRQASVPIISCKHIISGMNCDIGTQNILGVYNSKLIKYYLDLDEKLRPLMILIKYLFDVNNFKKGGFFSSYSLTIMFIFYLQQPPFNLPPVKDLIVDGPLELGWNPNFQSIEFDSSPLRNASYLEVFSNFLKFYADYNYMTYVISPYMGKLIERIDFLKDSLPDCFAIYKRRRSTNDCEILNTTSALVIQDPFQHDRNISASTITQCVGRFAKYCDLFYQVTQKSEENLLYTLLSYYEASIKTEFNTTIYFPLPSLEISPLKFKDCLLNVLSKIYQTAVEDVQHFPPLSPSSNEPGFLTVFFLRCQAIYDYWSNRQTTLKNIFPKLANMSPMQRELAITEQMKSNFHTNANISFHIRGFYCKDKTTIKCVFTNSNVSLKLFHYIVLSLKNQFLYWLEETCAVTLVPTSETSSDVVAIEINPKMKENNKNANQESGETPNSNNIIIVPKQKNAKSPILPTNNVSINNTNQEKGIETSENSSSLEQNLQNLDNVTELNEVGDTTKPQDVEEEEDVPADFFDDFSNADFMEGLDIVDAWNEEATADNTQSTEHQHPTTDIVDKLNDREKSIKSKSDRVNNKEKDGKIVLDDDVRNSRDKRKLTKENSRNSISPSKRLRPRSNSRGREIERERARDRDRDKERERREKFRERERERDRGRERDRERDQARNRGYDRERDQDRARDRNRERDQDRARDRDRERDQDRDRDRDREREQNKDRERDRDQDRDKRRQSPSQSAAALRRDPEKTKRDINRDKEKCARGKELKLVNDKLKLVETGLVPPGTEMEVDVSSFSNSTRPVDHPEVDSVSSLSETHENNSKNSKIIDRRRASPSPIRTKVDPLTRTIDTSKYRAAERKSSPKYRSSERIPSPKYRAAERIPSPKYRAAERNPSPKYRSVERSYRLKSPSVELIRESKLIRGRANSRSPPRNESNFRRKREFSRDSQISDRELWLRNPKKRSRSESPNKTKRKQELAKKKTFLEEIREKLNEVSKPLAPLPASVYQQHPQMIYQLQQIGPVPVPAPIYYDPNAQIQQQQQQHQQIYDQSFFIGNYPETPAMNTLPMDIHPGHPQQQHPYGGGMVVEQLNQQQQQQMPLQLAIVPQQTVSAAPSPGVLLPQSQRNLTSVNLSDTSTSSPPIIDAPKNKLSTDVSQLFADKKISLSDFLAITAKSEVQSANPEHIQKKVKVISRCQDIVKIMSDEKKFSGPLQVKFASRESKSMNEVKHQSPLRKIPIVRFSFTTPPKNTEPGDHFNNALDKILKRVGLLQEPIDLDLIPDASIQFDQSIKTTNSIAVAGKGTIKEPFACEECKKRKLLVFTDVGTQCVDINEKVSVETQVCEEDINPPKVTNKESLASLTPAQLLGKEKEESNAQKKTVTSTNEEESKKRTSPKAGPQSSRSGPPPSKRGRNRSRNPPLSYRGSFPEARGRRDIFPREEVLDYPYNNCYNDFYDAPLPQPSLQMPYDPRYGGVPNDYPPYNRY